MEFFLFPLQLLPLEQDGHNYGPNPGTTLQMI